MVDGYRATGPSRSVRSSGVSRFARVALALALVAALAGGVATVLALRPPLRDAEEVLDARWRALATALDLRYDALDREVAAVEDALDEERALLKEVGRELARWDDRGAMGPDDQTALANRLEGLAARIDAFVASSPRLRVSEAVRQHARAFDDHAPRQAAQFHDEAVEEYEDVRTSLPRRLVASLLGYDSRRTFEPS